MTIEINGETCYTVGEAAQYLGVSRETFYKSVRKGDISGYQQGILKRTYYRQSDLDALRTLRPKENGKDRE